MKFHRIALAILAAGSVCAAQAADGTVTITGSLAATTCGVATASQAISVTLPGSTATGLLANLGDTSGLTGFDISVINCYGKSSLSVAFDNTSANVDANGRLINKGTATNVAVELTDSTGTTPINIKTSTGSTATIDSKAGTGKLSLAARYYSLGAATAGTVTTNIGFTVTYQ